MGSLMTLAWMLTVVFQNVEQWLLHPRKCHDGKTSSMHVRFSGSPWGLCGFMMQWAKWQKDPWQIGRTLPNYVGFRSSGCAFPMRNSHCPYHGRVTIIWFAVTVRFRCGVVPVWHSVLRRTSHSTTLQACSVGSRQGGHIGRCQVTSPEECRRRPQQHPAQGSARCCTPSK